MLTFHEFLIEIFVRQRKINWLLNHLTREIGRIRYNKGFKCKFIWELNELNSGCLKIIVVLDRFYVEHKDQKNDLDFCHELLNHLEAIFVDLLKCSKEEYCKHAKDFILKSGRKKTISIKKGQVADYSFSILVFEKNKQLSPLGKAKFDEFDEKFLKVAKICF